MNICRNCVLPGTYPGINFDKDGICNYCRAYTDKKKHDRSNHFNNEEEVVQALKKYKSTDGQYDLLFSASGGVDSSFALIRLVERYNLKPLVWHNDHGYEHETATDNVRKLCKALKVDLIIWQHDIEFMKKLWKCTFETCLNAASTCFVCANILYWNAVELAKKHGIKLIINGYSKGQAAFDKVQGRALLNRVIEAILATGDIEFFDTFIKKYEIMNIHKSYETKQDLLAPPDPDKIMVLPFFIFDFYKTDKEYLGKICRERFGWQQMDHAYPARTTNCRMNWLTTYVDLKRFDYSIYTDEYSGLIRAGEISRDQALADLAFNPSPGSLEQLAAELGMDLDRLIAKTR